MLGSRTEKKSIVEEENGRGSFMIRRTIVQVVMINSKKTAPSRTKDDVGERAVHSLAHDIGQGGARAADQGAGVGEQRVVQPDGTTGVRDR